MGIGRMAVAIGTVVLGLSGCAAGLADRPGLASLAGQTFHVVPATATEPTADFGRYAETLAKGLEARGHRQAASPEAADMLVRLDYDIRQDLAEFRRPWRTGGRRSATTPPGAYADDGPIASGFVGTGAPGNTNRAYTVTEIRWRAEIVRQADMVPLFEGDSRGWRPSSTAGKSRAR